MTFVPFVVKTVVVALVVSVALVVARAYERLLDPAQINQAIRIGTTSSEADRARFHRPYRIDINRAPVDWVDVVTPFRRVVLGAESHTRDGGRLYGQRDANALLATAPAQVDVVVELTFHPLNTFVGVPAYDVMLASGDVVLEPASVDLVPRFGPRVAGTPLPYPFGGTIRSPRGSEPLLGGTIAAHFDGQSIAADAVYDVVLRDRATELARVRVSFAALR